VTNVDRSRLPRLGPDPVVHFPHVEKRRLPNGLHVWTVEHHGLPVCTFILLVPGGAAEDQVGRAGLAGLTAEMLDEGSGGRTAIEVQEAFARIGEMFDTEVGSDATLLTLTVLSRFSAEGLSLVADVVSKPRFEAHEYVRVRDLRLNRLTQLRDLPPSLADRTFIRALYGDHPYGHLPLGTESGVAGSLLDEVIGLHQRVYRPSSATLVAVGDASHDELAALAEGAFGAWGNGPVGPNGGTMGRPVPAPPEPPGGRQIVIVDRPGAAQSELRIGHLGVDRRTPDYHALLVLNMILGGQFTSRLNLRLREQKGYTYGVRTLFDCRRGRGPFVAQLAVQTRVSADAIADAVAEIESIRGQEPPTPEELELARAGLTRGYPRNFETAEQIARAVVQMALYGLPEDYFECFVPSVASVDADQVTAVAASHLDPARMLTVIVGDQAAVEPSLSGMDLGERRVVTVD
jgi:zinc protease